MNLLDFLFPKRCLGCSRVGKYLCEKCSLTIQKIEANEAICPVCEKPAIDGWTHPCCKGRYTIDGLTSFFRYRGVVKQAIKAIKYRYASDITEELMNRIPLTSYNNIPWTTTSPAPVVCAIPLHPSRVRFRGFNQSEIITKFIANRLGLQMWQNILIRQKNTIPQVEMRDRKMRVKNMEGVFAVNVKLYTSLLDKSQHKQRNVKETEALESSAVNILLVDDIFTTGATMRAAANILKRAGVSFVWGITVAR